MASINRKNTGGRIILSVFATSFILIGLSMLILAVLPSLYDWIRMQSWVHVEAQLISANLKSFPEENGTTYRIDAQYRYNYKDNNYTGTRVAISENADNIGDWHQETYSRLQTMHPLQVWVNPNDPRESTFDRDLRWIKLGFYMIFVLVFAGAGAGMLWLASRRPVAIQEGVPLWLGHPAWRDNQIRSNAKAGVWIIWTFTVLWILTGSPTLVIFPAEWAKGNHLILLALLYPVAGLGLIAYAMKRTLEWRRFGDALLSLDPFPGSIGGDVGGSIRLHQLLPRDAIANVQLSCVKVTTRNSGDESHTDREIKWQDEQQVQIETSINSSVIRFRFMTPEDLPESAVDTLPCHEWILQITCALPGVDLERRFEIPVFKTSASKQSARLSRSVANLSTNISVPEHIMQVAQTSNGLRLFFPILHGRNPGRAFAFTGAVMLGYTLVFIHVTEHGLPPFFILAFGGIGMLLFIPGLYYLGNSLTVVANPRGLEITRRIFGLPLNKHIPAANIRAIDISRFVQSQSSSPIAHYNVKVFTRDKNKYNVAESITGISAAEQVARQIRKACNLRS